MGALGVMARTAPFKREGAKKGRNKLLHSFNLLYVLKLKPFKIRYSIATL